eukprot:GHVU01196764.1.p5 GENE.GHVU01196764.1~~GHVU01196764.1.p5  ORF type:complete len:106 (+),score=12.52 GHVU01196764.1:1996-2313(+)
MASADAVTLTVEEDFFRSRDIKVPITVNPVGGAPLLKQNRFTVRGTSRFAEVVAFLEKATKYNTLHVYCNSCFEPAPDEFVGDLYKCFKVGNNLVLQYSPTPAFS